MFLVQNAFQRNQSTTIRQIIKGVYAKKTQDNSFISKFLSFDFIHRGKMEQILLVYDLKKTVTVIMMLYKNHESMVHLSNGDTNFFDIVTRVLKGDTLTLFLFIN